MPSVMSKTAVFHDSNIVVHCKTCSNIIQRLFSPAKFENLIRKIFKLMFLLKTLIRGTQQKPICKALLTSTHNLCFALKIKKMHKLSVYMSKSAV